VQELFLSVGDVRTSASVHGDGETSLLLGHGAGGDRRQASLLRLAEVVAASGRRAILYNFPYREAGRRVPDPPPVLEATVVAAAALARDTLGARRLVLGGRSMGGRIASQAVAAGLAAHALVFLAYPLHPPGRPQQLRDRHLGQVACPMLFVQGTRDAFARWDMLTALLARLGPLATLAAVQEADHSFAVPKRAGVVAAEVEATLHGAVLDWLARLGL
jgi:uncharacterized protein